MRREQNRGLSTAVEPRGTAPAVVVQDLHHAFGPIPVIDGISFEVANGEFCSIVGPSGCGKTTCLNMIAGELTPQQGSVQVLGSPPRIGRLDLSYMFARDALMPWRTALGNVVLGLESRRMPKAARIERGRQLLQSVGLGDYLDAYPSQLSHGMRQRVAIARTFAVSPDLLLMDEPFAALDAQTRVLIEDTLIKLWENERSTVVFVTHDLAEAIVLSDRIILMSARPGTIKRIFDIPIPRPRLARKLQGTDDFQQIFEAIWTDLEEEVAAL